MCVISQYKDLLQLMIDATGEEEDADEEKDAEPPAECPAHKPTKKSGTMTDNEVLANALGFMAAGNETTATTLAFASYALALHPEIQERLQSEIDIYFDEKPVSDLHSGIVYGSIRPPKSLGESQLMPSCTIPGMVGMIYYFYHPWNSIGTYLTSYVVK